MIKQTTLIKIIYKNEDGFVIALGSDNVTYKGTLLEDVKSLLNTPIEFNGKITDYKGKEQFNFSSYKIKLTYTDYFLEKMVTGLSKKAIVDIKQKCGDNFESIVENNPSSLLSIKGIGEKSLSKIVNSYKSNKHLKKIADFLLPFGLTNNSIKKLYDTYGDETVEILNENPYKLIELKGISFKKADEIAVKLGLVLSSDYRIYAGMKFAIEDHSISFGHTRICKDDYIRKSKEVLDTEGFSLDEVTINNTIRRLIENNEIISLDVLNTNYSMRKHYEMESFIYETFKANKNTHTKPLIDDIDSFIINIENKTKMKFDEKQKDVVHLVNRGYRCSYLSGFAGTGKSTSSKASMELYASVFGNNRVVGCALSGIAAKRIESVTGFQSYTIHTLLGFKGVDFEYNEDNKLDYDFILVDESSMIDLYLFYKLLKAVDLNKTTILLVGDPSQLKSVAAGNIFEDVIENRLLYGFQLEKVFRQKNEQIINVFATHFIRNGKVPKDYKSTGYEDFLFHTHELKNSFKLRNSLSPEEYKQRTNKIKDEILNKIKNIAINNLDTLNYWKTDIWKYITNFQVITPMKGGPLGSENINNELQSVFNPKSTGQNIELSKKTFKAKDKVIHLQNLNMKTLSTQEFKIHLAKKSLKVAFTSEEVGVTKKIFNGELGVIVDIDLEADITSVYYPNTNIVVLYNTNHFKQNKIDLAYAITIHKSQGMEYNNIVIPMTSSHYVMLNNNLLYTAITRAKKNLDLVGETFAFEHACKNKEDVKRCSVIQSLCKQKAIKVG